MNAQTERLAEALRRCVDQLHDQQAMPDDYNDAYYAEVLADYDASRASSETGCQYHADGHVCHVCAPTPAPQGRVVAGHVWGSDEHGYPRTISSSAPANAKAGDATKPLCYLRYLNGEPDWSEDCLITSITDGRTGYDPNDGYTWVPLTPAQRPAAITREIARAVLDEYGAVTNDESAMLEALHSVFSAQHSAMNNSMLSSAQLPRRRERYEP